MHAGKQLKTFSKTELQFPSKNDKPVWPFLNFDDQVVGKHFPVPRITKIFCKNQKDCRLLLNEKLKGIDNNYW